MVLLLLKHCAVLCLVSQSGPSLCSPMDCSPPGSSVREGSPGKNTGVGCHALLQGIFPTQGLKPRAPALQAESLPSEPPGKSMNTGVGSLSLLQGIFLTKKLNWGLLHCRWILQQLSYEGSPYFTVIYFIVDIFTWFSLFLRHFLVLKMRVINLSFLNLEKYAIFVNRK